MPFDDAVAKKPLLPVLIVVGTLAAVAANCQPAATTGACKEDISPVLDSFQRSLAIPKTATRPKLVGPVLVWKLAKNGSALKVTLGRSSGWKALDDELLRKAKSLRFAGAARCGVQLIRQEFSPSFFDADLPPPSSRVPAPTPAPAK
jgi:outer membrane biosynthesis protein TonB